MKQIINGLFISNYPEVAAMPQKKRDEFVKIAVLYPWEVEEDRAVAWERYQIAPWKIRYCDYNIPFNDPEGKDIDYLNIDELDRVANQIQINLSLGKKTIVYCLAGLERSPTAVIYYLSKYHGMPIESAHDFLKKRYPEVSSHSIDKWLRKLDAVISDI